MALNTQFDTKGSTTGVKKSIFGNTSSGIIGTINKATGLQSSPPASSTYTPMQSFPGSSAPAPLQSYPNRTTSGLISGTNTTNQNTITKLGSDGSKTVTSPAKPNPNVLAQQKALNALGAGLVEDGIAGPKTSAAIAKYGSQLYNTGSKTDTTKTTPEPTPKPTPEPTPKPGFERATAGLLDQGQSPYNQSIQQAQKGLIDVSSQNLGTSGPAYDEYQQAITNLQNLRSQIAGQTAGIENQPISMQFVQGKQQAMARQNASLLAAAEARVQSAASALGYGIQGQQAQIGGLQQAGTLGTTGQQLAQSALGTAAGYLTPTPTAQGQVVFNPETKQFEGGGTSSYQDRVKAVADAIRNDSIGFTDGVNTLASLSPTAKSDIMAQLGPGFDIVGSDARAQATTAATVQTGTVGGTLVKSAESANAALDKLEEDYNRLSSLQTGGIPLTNNIANWIAEKFGQRELSAYKTTLADARAQLQGILTSSGAATPTGAESMAMTYLPDDMTPKMFEEKLAAARILVKQKVEAFTRAPGGATSGGATGGGVFAEDWTR